MTQDLTLGITAGSSQTVAVTATDAGRTDRLTVRTGPTAPGLDPDLARTLPARVGDPVDIRTDDGRALAPADLLAEAIAATVRDVDPASTVAAFPGWWSTHAVQTQRDALDRADLSDVVLVPEPAAAVHWAATTHDIAEGTTVVVYDLGATGVTVSLADTGRGGGPRGESLRSTSVAGDEFDLLIMRYVLANAVGDNDFDPFDPAVEQELAIVRQRSRNAKEILSANTATSVPVRLPGVSREVRLVRDEIEDLLRLPLLSSVGLIGEAMRRAGVDRDAVGHILLTGGGASIPLVTELISTEFGIPVLAAQDPAHTSASGAALLAAELLAEAAVPETVMPSGELLVDSAAALPDVTKTPVLPELPKDTGPERSSSRRRVILIAAAAIAAATLATGTLALGTTTPTTSSPATVSNTTTASNSTTPNPASGGAVASAAPRGAGTSGGTTTSAVPGSTIAPAAPAANSATTRNGITPTAANPAPTAGATAQQQPQSPAPQGNSTQPPNSAAQPPVTVITAPTIPAIPTAPLGNSSTNPLNQTGNTLGTVLQVPGKILPQTGK
ncbi:Hsp70 family protein [Nocardia macrotermitis]|uniref:Chaperone protein HscA n=1 Tax=Nocardia macrotermitis TaxID=2585198 RepID=A0A7K0DE23_9NOCA|nr:Hsp70 family protein [Nocardia macrotermitis]MQY24056.1 Chaperone protein HscA [Nocardia macrotermitis]